MLLSPPMVLARLVGLKWQTRRMPQLPRAAPQHIRDFSGEWEATTIGGPGVKDARGRPFPEHAAIWHPRTGFTIHAPWCAGDRIWWREAWRTSARLDHMSGAAIADASLNAGYSSPWAPIQYEADQKRNGAWNGFGLPQDLNSQKAGRYRHGRFMPRWAARLVDEVTEVRAQRLQEISEADAIAEGIERLHVDSLGRQQWRMYPHTDGVPGEEVVTYVGKQYTLRPIESYKSLWLSIHGPGSWDANPFVWPITFKSPTDHG
jgi:hypothetical protein